MTLAEDWFRVMRDVGKVTEDFRRLLVLDLLLPPRPRPKKGWSLVGGRRYYRPGGAQ